MLRLRPETEVQLVLSRLKFDIEINLKFQSRAKWHVQMRMQKCASDDTGIHGVSLIIDSIRMIGKL